MDEKLILIKSLRIPKKSNLTLRQIADLLSVSKQSLVVAIKLGRLKAVKNKCWRINIEDLKEYYKTKYSRDHFKVDGELVFNKEKGLYSVTDASNILKIHVNKVYYAIYTNKLKADRKRCAYVINIDAIRDYAKNYLKVKLKKAI